MKKYALALVIAFVTVGCSNNERVTGERTRTTAAVNNDRRDFEDRVQARIDKIEMEIREWKEHKAEAKTKKAKRVADRRIDDLEQLKDDTKAKYSQLKGETSENWDKFKSEVSEAVDKLEGKWNELKADVKDKTSD